MTANTPPDGWWSRWRRQFKQGRNLRRIARRDRDFAARATHFLAQHPQLPLDAGFASEVAEPFFAHAGNAGDVIFALPALRALAAGRPAHLRLQVDAPAFYAEGVHPLGAVQLDAKTVEMMRPLLESQDYLASAGPLGDETIHCRLDLFRDAPLPGDKGSIARWYFYCFGVFADLAQPWLQVEPDAAYADYVVIARSQRYRNPVIDHRFLDRYPKIAFIGVDAEFEEMQEKLPRIERVRIPDFLTMARVIAGARVFVGNQSLPYSIAEALKARRILEACPRVPTNVPEGRHAFEAWFQPHLEALVERVYRLPR